MRGWVKGVIGVGALVAAGGALFVSMMYNYPRAVWASGPGQAILQTFVRTAEPAERGLQRALVGQPLPALQVKTADGAPAVLAHQPGRPMLINYWASWCGPCIVEMPVLDAAAKGAFGKKVSIVGVSIDKEAKDALSFLAENPVSYPTFWDPHSPGNSRAKLGGGGGEMLPFSVLVDADGKIAKVRLMGFEPGEIERWARLPG